MLMQRRGNGFAGRRIAWHSYGIPSREYTGVKQGQMYGMNQCMCSNELSRLWHLAQSAIFEQNREGLKKGGLLLDIWLLEGVTCAWSLPSA